MPIPNYEGWWLGKMCRKAHSEKPFKKVVSIQYIGPPSFVYGFIILHFEDGTEETIAPEGKFRPRKKDVEVQEDE